MINKIIHGCLQIWNFSSRVQLDTKKLQQFIFSCFISYSFADLTLEKASWTLEEKFHINANQCIILYLLKEDEMAEFVIQPRCEIPEFQRISMRVCGSIAQWLVFKQPCNHRLLTTEKVVDECRAIKLNYKFSRKNYLGLELFDCPKVCLSFWNCSVVSSFSSNWVSTSLGADYCLNDREPFSVFTYSRLNTRGGWENLRKLCKPDTQSRVCITFNKFSNLPRVFKWDNVNTGKSTLYTLSIYHINYGVLQGFPALRKAVTTHVKKCRIF